MITKFETQHAVKHGTRGNFMSWPKHTVELHESGNWFITRHHDKAHFAPYKTAGDAVNAIVSGELE